MNTLSVASALKRSYFKIQGEVDNLPFALVHTVNGMKKTVAPVEYRLLNQAGIQKAHYHAQNVEGWLESLPCGAKVIIPHYSQKAVAAFEVFKQEAPGYWKTGMVEITPDMLDI